MVENWCKSSHDLRVCNGIDDHERDEQNKTGQVSGGPIKSVACITVIESAFFVAILDHARRSKKAVPVPNAVESTQHERRIASPRSLSNRGDDKNGPKEG